MRERLRLRRRLAEASACGAGKSAKDECSRHPGSGFRPFAQSNVSHADWAALLPFAMARLGGSTLSRGRGELTDRIGNGEMNFTGEGKFVKISLTIVAIAACGTLMAQPLEEERSRSETTPDASRITFGGNFAVDPCSTCKYDPDPSGYAVVGPDNCTEPGTTQWEAVPFIAAASGVPDRITTSLILENPTNCPQNKVTLSIYTDACYPKGPRTLLVSGEATVPASSCDLTVAKIRNAPSLVQGTKYWITATTTSQQSALDSRWYASNNAQLAYNLGDGWIQSAAGTPSFMMQGRASTETRETISAATRSFGSNMFVDPCTGCNYDPNASGFDVRGPDNCTLPGQTHWEAVPFVATRTGIPQRIFAPIILNFATVCPQNKVTLSIYTDNCGEGPGTLLVSGEATAQIEPCNLAVAKLHNAPSLTKNVKYWVTATTTAEQSGLDASWFASNGAQFALNLGGQWIQFSAGTPAFEVQ